MDVLKAMSAFSEVAKTGGFASAARSLGISTSSVSRQVIELEGWLGLTLLQRTTRSLSLTEEGARYLPECQKILDDVSRVQANARDVADEPKGTLRITAPVFLAKECIQKILPKFIETHPKITIELTAHDRFVDLVDEGYDLAIRVGELADSTLVARRLGELNLIVVASKRYLRSREIPSVPSELIGHNCIVDNVASFVNQWPFRIANKRSKVTVSGNIRVNNGEIARDLAVAGLGVALLPDFFVRDQLASGRLVELLRGQVDSSAGLFSVYPKSHHVSPKVRVFLDFLIDYLSNVQRDQKTLDGDEFRQ